MSPYNQQDAQQNAPQPAQQYTLEIVQQDAQHFTLLFVPQDAQQYALQFVQQDAQHYTLQFVPPNAPQFAQRNDPNDIDCECILTNARSNQPSLANAPRFSNGAGPANRR